jgi:hypothetical protein
MDLEGTLLTERTRTRRWVSIVAVTVPVFIVVGVAAWFIRAFVAPPMATIPAPMILAAAPPSAVPVPEARQAPSPEPTRASSPSAAQEGAAPLPMFGSFTLAPPSVSLRTAPRPNVEPDPSAGAEPTAAVDAAPVQQTANAGGAAEISEPAAASHDPTEPATSAVPMPPQRPRTTVALNNGRVPLPRPRPASEAPSTAAGSEQRMFNAHAVE